MLPYVDGKLAAASGEFAAGDYDLTNHQPLRIGFGQTDYFHGKIREVRVWKRALAAGEVASLAAQPPPSPAP